MASPRVDLVRLLCPLARLLLTFGALLFALSAQAAPCPPPQATNLPKPIYPVIFIHGINSSGDNAWGDMRCVLVANGWVDGGSPEWNGSSVTGVNVGSNDFYTLNFTKNGSRNNHDLTFFEQGFELAKIISSVKGGGKVILVGHSMGGLAARAYLQGLATMDGAPAPYAGDVHTLITVGTPHKGSMESKRCLDNYVSCRKIAGYILGLHPESIAAIAFIPDKFDPPSLDLRKLNSFVGHELPPFVVGSTLPPDVHYVSIVATWKYQNGVDRKTLTDIITTPPYLLYGDGGDGIVPASFQDLGQVDGFASLPAGANHTVVPVTFHDPLWNFAGIPGLVVAGPPACGNHYATGPLSIDEVHTCETHDAAIGFYILTNIPKTSPGALVFTQNVPLLSVIYESGVAQIKAGLQSFYNGPMNVQCRYGSSPDQLTANTGVTALLSLPSTQVSSCDIPILQGPSAVDVFFQTLVHPAPPGEAPLKALADISPTDPDTTVGPIYQLSLPPAAGVLLPAPTGLLPAADAVNQPLRPTLTWNTVPNATSFRIMLADDIGVMPTDPTDGNCDRCLVDFVPPAPDRTTYSPPAGLLTPGTTYYWQVHARSPDNFGTWTVPSSFTTQPLTPATLLPAPTQTAPADGDTGQSTMPILIWTPVTGATSYRVMIAPSAAALTTHPTSADCAACVTNAVVPGAQGTSYIPYVGLLAVGTTYYWSVKARSPDSYGAWSAVRSFTPIAEAQIVTEFSVGITAGAYPLGITAGPDGNLWFTEPADSVNRIGQITPSGVVTEFSLPSSLAEPNGITAGPDGNLWFIEWSYNGWNPKIGRINPVTGVVTEFSVPGGPLSTGIAAGADGNLWFGQPSWMASITPLGLVTRYNLLHSFSGGNCITAGPDGNLWYTAGGVEVPAGTIARITMAGVITEFYTGITSDGGLPCIAAGPDGNLWFTARNANVIGRITPAGVVTRFSAGISANAYPYSITAGPDGNLWFTEPGVNRIGRITPAGVVTEFSLPALAGPIGITAGPDGNIWFTEPSNNRIGRIIIGGGGANVPAAPTAANATAGNSQANVTFVPPASNGISAISSYTATCTPAAGLPVAASGPASPVNVPGLTNGVTYACTVHATNIVGDGPESLPTNPVTPSAAPAAALTISISGAGTGTLASIPTGIACPGDCTETYPAGTGVVMTATTTGGSIFTGWLGACTGTGSCTATVNGPTNLSATFAPASALPLRVDVDGSTTYDALTDGLIMVRYLFGLTGNALTSGALGSGATLTDPAQLLNHLNDIRPLFDVDGNGQVDGPTDGLMLIRYMFGLRGPALTVGAIGAGATRTTAAQIETYIQSLMP